MTWSVTVSFRVANFYQWKELLNAASGEQRAAGLVEAKVVQSNDDGHNAVVIWRVTNKDKAEDFLASREFRQSMSASGMLEEPQIFFQPVPKAVVP